MHIPFRHRDRAYDDAFVTPGADVDYEAFIHVMAREIRQHAEQYASELPLRSVYAGGGRPSLMPIEALPPLLRAANAFETDAIEEVSAEVSPKDATERYMKGLSAMGFNRLVLSVLSFDDAELDTIDAPHTVYDVRTCLDHARAAGIENISIDVAFGWPESTLEGWKRTLQTAVQHDVPHITLLEWPSYAVDEAQKMLRTKQYRYALRYLQDEGFEPYEISHFAQPGYRSKHNENYWSHGSFLGIGPAAHSFWWHSESDNPKRWANVQSIEEYSRLLTEGESPASVRQAVDRGTLADEYLMMRMRVIGGLDLEHYRRHYGVHLREQHSGLIDRLQENELVHPVEDNHLRLTDAGRLVCDEIVRRLLPK